MLGNERIRYNTIYYIITWSCILSYEIFRNLIVFEIRLACKKKEKHTFISLIISLCVPGYMVSAGCSIKQDFTKLWHCLILYRQVITRDMLASSLWMSEDLFSALGYTVWHLSGPGPLKVNYSRLHSQRCSPSPTTGMFRGLLLGTSAILIGQAGKALFNLSRCQNCTLSCACAAQCTVKTSRFFLRNHFEKCSPSISSCRHLK